MNRKIIFAIAPFAIVCTTLIGCDNTPKKVDSITATSSHNTYNVGDVINRKDITVEATYDNKYKQNVSTWECSDFNETNLNMYTFTAEDGNNKSKKFDITYFGKMYSLSVNVSKPETVSKAAWLDKYDNIRNTFQSSTLEYTKRNIEQLYWDKYQLSWSQVVTGYTSSPTPRTFVIKFSTTAGTVQIIAGPYYTKEEMNGKLGEDTDPGVLFEVYDNYITYTNPNATTGYKKFSIRNDGYVIEQNDLSGVGYSKIKFRGELQPKAVTRAQWMEKYTTYSKTFNSNFDNKRYTSDNISVDGYIVGKTTSHYINAELYKSCPYFYTTTSGVNVFQIILDYYGEQKGIILGGHSYDYRYIYENLLKTLETKYDVEYILDTVNEKASFVCYGKSSLTIMLQIVFNKYGYIEKYLTYGNCDLNIKYNSEPQDKTVESYFGSWRCDTDQSTQEIISVGYGFDSKYSLTIKKGKTYKYCLYNCYEDRTISSTHVQGHFGIEKLSFTLAGLTDLNSVAEDFKLFVNKQVVECEVQGLNIVVKSGEIKSINTEVVFEFTVKNDIASDYIFTDIRTYGQLYK